MVAGYIRHLDNVSLPGNNSTGKYEQAEPLLTQALELTKRILGENHSNTIAVKQNLAVCWVNGIENGHFSIEILQKKLLFIQIITELSQQ